MYKNDGIRIRAELDSLIDNDKLTADGKVVVFGVSDFSRAIISHLKNRAIKVSIVLDNDVRKSGSFCNGVEVRTPNELVDSCGDKFFIVCSDLFGKEMYSQLLSMGIDPEKIIHIKLESGRESLSDNISDYFKGKKIYRTIRNKYPGKKIFFCPYTGTGDIYLIGTFLPQYIRENNIKDYVVVVVSKACEMVADIFSFDNVMQIDGPEATKSLIRYYMVSPEKCDIMVLNDCWRDIYTNPIQWIRGLHGMDFAEMFRRFVFYLDENAKLEHPTFKNVDSELDKIFSELDLHAGRTVILAPYATTLADMPTSFWENIAKWLLDRGFDVCTNCGSPDEREVNGTKRLFFPLNIAPQLIERAGYFIGIRSGFCDVISGAKAKKIILYDKANFFFNCSAYDYFSLRKMGLSNDAIEIEYDNTLISELEEEVKKKII